jgi:alcohol dehydrogenase
MFISPTKVYVGLGAHENLGEILAEQRLTKLFVVCDRAVAATDFFQNIESFLKKSGIAFDLFTDVDPEPSDKTVERALKLYQKNKCPATLAVGGGSSMDVAKAVGIVVTSGGRIHDYEGFNSFSTPPLPLVAIPTTAGTGSEVSNGCVISDTNRGLKMSIRNPALNPPKVAILDPLALTSLPATVAAHAAMDAFAHAFESYISLKTSLITDAKSLYAIELIAQNVRQFVSNRGNLDAGLKMQCGASLAAMAYSNTQLGNVHCMARFVGAFFHVSHGLSNALCLPYAAEFNMIANPEKFARVALAMGENVTGLTTMEAARKAVGAMRQLNRDIGIPEKLRDIGATEDKIPEMARLCVEANYTPWNPRHTTYDDFVALFEKAF